MKHLIVILLLLATSLLGSNPKLYSVLGDPIYNNLIYVEKISKLYAFNSHKKELLLYINEVKKEKKVGFRLDNVKNKQGIKDYRQFYLKKLRTLIAQSKKIDLTIKHVTFDTIDAKNRTRFYAIIDTKHPTLNKDHQLQQHITAYQKALDAEKKQANLKKSQANYKLLRSYKNLQKLWKGHQKDAKIILDFKNSTQLVLTTQENTSQQVIEGTYRLKRNRLTLTTRAITNIDKNKQKHTRIRTIKIIYTIKKITTKELILQATHKEPIVLKKVR